jgi:hypothetical protein
VFILLFTSAIQVSLASSQTEVETTISSSGLIVYNTAPPEQPEQPEPSVGSLPNSIIGEDYLLYYNNGSPEVWLQSGTLDHFTNWECNTMRLGFAFSDAYPAPFEHAHSDYVESKMDRVIEIFDTIGVKVILDNHNVGDHHDYLGSQAWIENWKAIAQHYKGDQRIAGFNIFNEPAKYTWHESVTTKEEFLQACADLIDDIRAIDPTRTIYFPTCDGMSIGYDDPTTTYNAMANLGIWAKGNIIMDILHPYYFENEWDMDLTPEEKVDWYVTNKIEPWVNLIGAEKCWIGETFAWTGKTKDLQVQYLTAMINECINYDVGLQVWSFFGKRSWCTEALEASSYLD